MKKGLKVLSMACVMGGMLCMTATMSSAKVYDCVVGGVSTINNDVNYGVINCEGNVVIKSNEVRIKSNEVSNTSQSTVTCDFISMLSSDNNTSILLECPSELQIDVDDTIKLETKTPTIQQIEGC